LRAGYGIFYDQILGNIVSQSRNIFPAFIPVDFGAGVYQLNLLNQNPAFLRVFPPGSGSKNGIPLIAPGTINSINFPMQLLAPLLGSELLNGALSFGFTLPDKKLRTPYAQQYSLSLERAIGSNIVAAISYVGALGLKLLRDTTPNGGPITALFFDSAAGINSIARVRPQPALGVINVFESSANSNYNSLQASIVRRSANGLGIQLAYTYSHAIDDVSDLFNLAGSYALAQDETGLQGGLRDERASANFDVRHRFTAGWLYDLPFAKSNRLLGGFRLSGILALQTGQPFTVNSRLDVNRDGNLTDRLNTMDGLMLADGLTRISLAPGRSELNFLAPNSMNGAVGRNTFRAAGISSLDLALEKQFSFKESQRMLLRIEAFNIFNCVNFGIPVRILGAPGFGSSVNTTISARIVQFAVRYQF
jgi:hypothetical protein